MADLGESFKFKQRRARIMELERLQELEDVQHLSMTPEQRALLHQTFDCVRTDFEDLDGLSWECESAKEVLRDWKRKQLMLESISRCHSHALPALKRSSSITQSSSGFLPPVSMSRTRRPHIPFALTNTTSTPAPPKGPRVASVLLNRDETVRASYRDTGDDATLPALRPPLSASHSLSRLSTMTSTLSSATCSTLGRSWRKGAKARAALPSDFLPSRTHDDLSSTPTRQSAMAQYLDSDGAVLEPLDSVLTEPDEDVLRDASADAGLGFVNILGDLGTQIDETPFRVDESSETRTALARHAQPPILAASPRLGGFPAGLGAGSRCGSPRMGGSPRLAGSVRQWSVGSPASPRASFHRERCSISKCRSGWRRGVPVDLQHQCSDSR